MKKAFTITELLICVTILVLLAALTYPLSAAAIQTAKETKVRSNLSQILKASLIYTADYQDHFAPGTIKGWPTPMVVGNPHLGFPVELVQPECRKVSVNDPLSFFGWWINWPDDYVTAKVLASYDKYGESMIVFSNKSCNPPDVTIHTTFKSRRAFGVELNGRVRVQRRPGDWERQDWWH